ncbi:MAG: DCC1-like thiol-disulfide oxidoreductase family protein [Pseudomonadota bacterium]
MNAPTESSKTNYLVYDGDCPFCSRYVRLVRLRDTIGPVELINARESHPVVDNLASAGYDLNEGMAFIQDEVVYYADAAIHRLALLSTPSTFFNRLNARLLGSSTISALIYPLLKAGRGLALRALGKRPIQR